MERSVLYNPTGSDTNVVKSRSILTPIDMDNGAAMGFTDEKFIVVHRHLYQNLIESRYALEYHIATLKKLF